MRQTLTDASARDGDEGPDLPTFNQYKRPMRLDPLVNQFFGPTV